MPRHHQARSLQTVLVVEDDYILSEIVMTMFERADLAVRQAATGEDALMILRHEGASVDWLLTDVNLPGLVNGWTVAAEYRLLHPLRPVLYASNRRRDDRFTVTGSIFVPKPYDAAQIMSLIAMMKEELEEAGALATSAEASAEGAALGG